MREQTFMRIPFPLKGLSENMGYAFQEEGTTANVVNMRVYDNYGTVRARGATRPGLKKWNSNVVSSSNRIQGLNRLVTVAVPASDDTRIATRTVSVVAVANGTIKYASSPTSSWTSVSGTYTINADAPVVFGADAFQNLYYVDGFNAVRLLKSSWTADDWQDEVDNGTGAGTFPANGSDLPRLIENWRGRVVLSGIDSDPQNWFMSKAGSPLNFDYSATDDLETVAVAGNNSPAGEVGEPINAIVPYNDDVLLFGCDNSIWMMSGDPAAGGRLDVITTVTGMAWGRPWCLDDAGSVYFFGNQGGFFRMAPGQRPERLSRNKIESRFRDIDLDTNVVTLQYNERELGVNIFIRSIESTGPSRAYFYDIRMDAFFEDRFGNTDHYPVCTLEYDGDAADDRAVVIGSEDGYVRAIDQTSVDDDGTDIESYVWLGPMQSQDKLSPFLVSELMPHLGKDNTVDVELNIYGGHSMQDATDRNAGVLQSEDNEILITEGGDALITEDETLDPCYTQTISTGRNRSFNPRCRMYAGWVELRSSSGYFSMEEIVARLTQIPSSRKRIF